MTIAWIKTLFVVAGVYDGVLGPAFLLFGQRIYELSGVTPPNHVGYVQFPSLLLIIFAVMFFRVAADPVRNRELMLYGAGLKLAYCGVVFGHDLVSGLPKLWIPWAWADLVFLVLFLIAWRQTAKG
jgi:hypothetical protein